jgi:serine/threonine protein kinase
MRQLMQGVRTVHSKGFSHRDLKVDNLVFDEENQQLKIIDFGFALEVAPTTPIKQTCGTPAYMDPD